MCNYLHFAVAIVTCCALLHSDLDTYSPPDFQPEPEGFLPLVTDTAIRKWALQVHALWPYLSRIVRTHLMLCVRIPGPFCTVADTWLSTLDV